MAQGQILESRLRERHGPKGPSFSAEIRYVYEVNGGRFQGTRVRFGPTIESRAEAQAAVSDFPAGKRASVYFNPDDPSEAVLEPGRLHGYWIWQLGVGLALAGVAGWLGFLAWRARTLYWKPPRPSSPPSRNRQ